MNKSSVKSGRAYTYNLSNSEGTECGIGKDDLEAKARQKNAEARENVERRIEELKTKREGVEDDSDRLRSSGEDAREDLKGGIDSAANALGEMLQSARSRF